MYIPDPYAIVSFCGVTQQTERQAATLCPTWDQTLLFDDIVISGPLLPVQGNCLTPPDIFIEVYDWDARVCIIDCCLTYFVKRIVKNMILL